MRNLLLCLTFGLFLALSIWSVQQECVQQENNLVCPRSKKACKEIYEMLYK